VSLAGELELLVGIVGLVLLGVGAWALVRIVRARGSGTLVAADDGRAPPLDLVSEEFGLVGRPDEIRRRSDGRLVPVEIKSRVAPPSGVLGSHRVQVEAYCLLLESTSWRSPPYGLVVYRGGIERIVPWDARARHEVTCFLAELRSPYDGRATPTPGKCRGCRWHDGCDARAG
jgi:CRISPR/Cas system-associated exonuclease Cas4 (RecB family)